MCGQDGLEPGHRGLSWLSSAGRNSEAEEAAGAAARAAEELKGECTRLSTREAELLAAQRRLIEEAAAERAELERLRKQAAAAFSTAREEAERTEAAMRAEADQLRQQIASVEIMAVETAAEAAEAVAEASGRDELAAQRLRELEAALVQQSEAADARLAALEQGRRDAEASAVLAIQGQHDLQAWFGLRRESGWSLMRSGYTKVLGAGIGAYVWSGMKTRNLIHVQRLKRLHGGDPDIAFLNPC
jgi:hypothetical protein